MRKTLSAVLLFCVSFGPAFAGYRVAEAGSLPLLERLAGPEFEGRGVGTQGLARARDILVEELARAGLEPGFVLRDAQGSETGRSYLQGFPVFTGNELGERNFFADSSPVDFVPLAFSRSGWLERAELVFVGYGISFRGEVTGDGFQYDDYAGLDVRGKIVIALLGDPSIGNRSSVFRNPALYHYATPMYKVQNAELHGAAGIVLVRDALSLGDGPEPALQFLARQGGGASVSILAGQARIEFVERIVRGAVVGGAAGGGAAGATTLRELQAWIAREQRPASMPLPGRHGLSVELKRQVGEAQNVAALLSPRPGPQAVADPGALASEFIVIGAHYDHLGYGGDSSMDPEGTGKIHPGADDNASGVQAVMDLARRIRDAGMNRRPVYFVFFTAEEIGLLGSKHWVESLRLPAGGKLVWMLNLDMVGRMDGRRLSVLATASAKEFKGLLEEKNRDFGFELQTSDSGFGSSDHAAFLQAQVPALFLTTGAHADYHRPSDTAEKINAEGLGRVEDFAFALWQALDARTEPPTFDPSSQDSGLPPRQDRGYGVYFGSVPEFQQGDSPGVLLSGVRPGSPAERAGLQKGDLLVGLGEIEIRSLNDLVFALRFYRPGDRVEVRWMRFGVAMKAETTLQARN